MVLISTNEFQIGTQVEIILDTSVAVTEDESIEENCKEDIDAVERSISQIDPESLVYSKNHGLVFLQKSREHSVEVGKLKADNGVITTRTAGLESKVLEMSLSLKAYTTIRNRFLAKYKRDNYRDKMCVSDWEVIKAGDKEAHGGNLHHDAIMFKERMDD